MREMSVRQLREALPSLEQIVEQEGELLLTRHGHPVAKVVSLHPCREVPTHADLRASMAYSAVGSEALIRAERDSEAERA